MNNLVLGILTLVVPAIAIGAYAIARPQSAPVRESWPYDFFRHDLAARASFRELLVARISPVSLHLILERSFWLLIWEALRDTSGKLGMTLVWWRRTDESPVGWEYREDVSERGSFGDMPTPDDLPRRDEIATALLGAIRDVYASPASLDLPPEVSRSIAEQTCRKLEASDPLAFAFAAQVLARFVYERSEGLSRKERPSADR